MSCPYGVRYLNQEERVVEKCTLCEQRIAQGELPSCVAQCGGRARFFGDLDKGIEDIQATLDFINWCVTSEQGTKAMADDMGFVIPFKTAQESPNLFVKQDAEMTAAGKTPVSWNFTTMPSEEWKNGVGSALTAYAAGTGDWNGVVSAFVDGWAAEAALNAA